MSRRELVTRAKAILAEAYEEAAEMIVLYLEDHPSEQIKPLCREVDPDNWSALDARVRRARDRKARSGAESSATDRILDRGMGTYGRKARQVLREAEPEEIAELLDDPTIRQNVAAAARVRELRTENRTGIPARNSSAGPTFISLVLKINGWLDELIGMVERSEAEVPVEFSTQSLSDIGVKAMRLKELVDEAREAEGVLSHD